MTGQKNRRLISVEERKKLSLDILKYVDSYCRENNIKYFLAYGTLLGAVRHKGFIPWDDDIDLIMFRDDYNKFISNFNNKENVSKYKVLSFDYETFSLPYAKVTDTETCIESKNMKINENLGIGIDVFPFDYISNDYREAKRKKEKLDKLKKILRYSMYNNVKELSESGRSPFIKRVFYLFSKTIGTSNITKHMNKKIRKFYNSEKTEYCDWYCSDLGFTKSCYFDEAIEIDFEDSKFKAPKRYDEILKSMYGNYMQLPPEDKRIGHSETAWYRE